MSIETVDRYQIRLIGAGYVQSEVSDIASSRSTRGIDTNCDLQRPIERKKMNSRLDNLWYAIQHPLGPSRELGSYANHQESVEKLIREMKARVHPD
jgi:hypothetical protein